MFTAAEAHALRMCAARSSDHEDKIDAKLKAAIIGGNSEKIGYVVDDESKALAQYLAARYIEKGWKVDVEEIERDRAFSAPTYYKLVFTLPPLPARESTRR